MTIPQVSDAKFVPKVHIASGLAANKQIAGSKLLGSIYHSTDALPNGSLAADLGHGAVRLCKQNNATVPAPEWSDVTVVDWCGMVTLGSLGGGTAIIDATHPASNGVDISQLRATSIVKCWAQARAGASGFITPSINVGVAVTITSTEALETSTVYVEITY